MFSIPHPRALLISTHFLPQMLTCFYSKLPSQVLLWINLKGSLNLCISICSSSSFFNQSQTLIGIMSLIYTIAFFFLINTVFICLLLNPEPTTFLRLPKRQKKECTGRHGRKNYGRCRGFLHMAKKMRKATIRQKSSRPLRGKAQKGVRGELLLQRRVPVITNDEAPKTAPIPGPSLPPLLWQPQPQ